MRTHKLNKQRSRKTCHPLSQNPVGPGYTTSRHSKKCKLKTWTKAQVYAICKQPPEAAEALHLTTISG